MPEKLNEANSKSANERSWHLSLVLLVRNESRMFIVIVFIDIFEYFFLKENVANSFKQNVKHESNIYCIRDAECSLR